MGLRIRRFAQFWPHGLKVYTLCITMLFSLSSNSNSALIACRPNLAERVHVLSSDLWMEADVHRDLQVAEWPGDDTEWPGDDTDTGNEVLEIVCTCVKRACSQVPEDLCWHRFLAENKKQQQKK